jgi:hypothetical protein
MIKRRGLQREALRERDVLTAGELEMNGES